MDEIFKLVNTAMKDGTISSATCGLFYARMTKARVPQTHKYAEALATSSKLSAHDRETIRAVIEASAL